MNEQINTIPRQIRSSAVAYGSRQAVSDGDVSLTYDELAESSLEVARALISTGVAPGDRVAIWAPNSHHFVRMVLGTQSVGAIVVPINTRYRAAEARELVARTSARVALVHSGFLGFDYRSALVNTSVDREANTHSVESLEVVVDLGTSQAVGSAARANIFGWDEFAALAKQTPVKSAVRRADGVGPADLSAILFTSGTTGKSKGVTLAHGASLDLYRNYADIWGLRTGDRYLVSLPMFHAGGINAGILTCLVQGLTIVPMAVFDTVETMKIVARERITVMNAPPTVILSILDHPHRHTFDLSSLRTMATGAAVVPVAMVERAQTELPFEHFITAYGMTECYGTATMCRIDDSNETIANTNGRPVPGVRLRVVDNDGNDLPSGVPGEILISGPNITPGYWQGGDVVTPATVDGWLHSGDIGTIDASGNLKITDRLKDMFLVGGFNVSPAEIEQVLTRHPAVGEVSVIGVPDQRLGEVARAYIIRKPDSNLTEDEVIAWCRERIANFKVPRSVVFIDTLPRNASGKVLKIKLRQTASSSAD